MFNMSIFSCATSDIADEIGMEEVATEGEDGETTEQGDENS